MHVLRNYFDNLVFEGGIAGFWFARTVSPAHMMCFQERGRISFCIDSRTKSNSHEYTANVYRVRFIRQGFQNYV